MDWSALGSLGGGGGGSTKVATSRAESIQGDTITDSNTVWVVIALAAAGLVLGIVTLFFITRK